MNLINNLSTRAFGGLSVEEKRAFVSKTLVKHAPSNAKRPSTGEFSAARTKLLEKFALDKPLSRGTGHYLYDADGREYLDFSSQHGARPAGQNPSNPSEGQHLIDRVENLRATYPSVIKSVNGDGLLIDVEFHPFDGDDGSGTLAYCSLNGYLAALVSSYLLNVHRIVTAPMSDRSHVLRLQPPLNLDRSEINRVVDAITMLCDALDRRDAYQVVHHLVGTTPKPRKGGRRYANGIQRPSSEGLRVGADRPKGKFAFLIHLTTEQDYVRADPSFEQFTAEEFKRWREWLKAMGPGVVHHLDEIESPDGRRAEGWIITVPLLPRDMLVLGRKKMLALLVGAMRLAKDRGAAVLGLGGFTSIMSGGGGDLTGKGMAITSGNTLTTVTAIAGIEDVMARAGLDLAQARAAVVGASGAIGRLASLMLARRVGSLTLVGNPSNPNALRNCRNVAGEIYSALLFGNSQEQGSEPESNLARQVREIVNLDEDADLLRLAGAVEAKFRESGLEPPIEFSVDPETALSKADVVLVATNSDTAIIRPHHLKQGAIVCDVARPPNVPDDLVDYRNVLVFDGGMVELPQKIAVGSIQGLSPGVAWGCLAETILLAVEGETADHSIGQKLTLAEADHIARLANKHGFRPAPTQWYGRPLTEEDFRRIGPARGSARLERNVVSAQDYVAA